ncbi:MAG: enoyl-CoA hydratase-related protein [Thermoplasmata archaeon]
MIELEKKNDITVIYIDNPPMNVLCSELLHEMHEALETLEGDEETRAVVVTGKGRAFVAGADIKEMMEMSQEDALDFAELGQGALTRLEELPVPVIAAVNGFALGGGTELALACDIRIASEAAKFGQPEVNLGVIPGFGGTQRLPRAIGPGKAKELIYTGDIIDAKEALEIGLVQHVLPGYKVDENGETVKNEKGRPVQDNGPVFEAAMDMAAKIASKGPIAINFAKTAMAEGMELMIYDGLELEGELFSELFETKDRTEGMEAFIEKRKPEFTGK